MIINRSSLFTGGSNGTLASLTKFMFVTESNQSSLNNNYGALINCESRRFGRRYRKWHHWPNDFLPFEWERPVQDPPYLRTGDSVRDIGMWDGKSLIPGAEYSKELANAPETVRRLFTLEFATRNVIVEYQKRKILNQVRRHPHDNVSPEVKIADYTVRIRNNLHHFIKIDKYDAPRKIRQEILKNRRNVLLKDLFYQDRERYEYITRLLGITHEVPKLGVKYVKPNRKSELQRLTKEYCDKIKEERLAQYHEELKAKQITLEGDIEKIEKLIKDDKYLGTSN